VAVDIVDSTFDGSHSTAINSGGDVTIRGSTISNSLRRAITNRGVMSLANSTISENSATFHDLDGRGIISNSGTLNLTHVTIANNTSGPPAVSGPNVYPVTGGIYNAGGTVNARSSLFANNVDLGGVPGDCMGPINSLGYNVFEAPQGCTIAGDLTGNVTGVDAPLAPLDDNSGETDSRTVL
jgi:hypothetical protein